ncbi:MULTISPECIES: lipopolysaccharide assembly protein LapA domain-containing protein [unclassified Rhodococcus (in: high G+C Gram-positive bacteria)]|uniref:lipopolysaccharide assembly protein LapA domain-containing protein n=1 Tax=unclassified Rhodococcus (in: high G+C Gram-positive bacteria) TaxID=192944 RepID=UPI0014479568|nr:MULTISPECIES: lipopolysaccharide assembly protein LapA domain-containing protein [unclassified Rhodococcus (in: high G+C Gram-positive bacteria)]
MNERPQQPDTTTTTSTQPGARSSHSATRILTGVAAVFLVIALVIFVLQNTEKAHVEFLGLNLDVAQGVSLLLAAVVGFLIAVLGSGVMRLRRRVHNRR